MRRSRTLNWFYLMLARFPGLTCSCPVRSGFATMWTSSSPAVGRRRRTGGARGRSWPGIAAGSSGAVRRWSRASGSACSRSTAIRSSRGSPSPRTPEDATYRWTSLLWVQTLQTAQNPLVLVQNCVFQLLTSGLYCVVTKNLSELQIYFI